MASSSSSASAGPSALPVTRHLIRLPSPNPAILPSPVFLAQITRLGDEDEARPEKSSLLIWCGEVSPGALEGIDLGDDQYKAQGEGTGAPQPAQRDELQEMVDRKADEELQRALQAAGREGEGQGVHDPADQDVDGPGAYPIGRLANEWGVAMGAVAVGREASGTSLFRTPADIALPMAKRLARKLRLGQVLLSLDLPPDMASSAGQTTGEEERQMLLSLELGLADAIKAALVAA